MMYRQRKRYDEMTPSGRALQVGACLFVLALLALPCLAKDAVTVSAAVDKQQVYNGETFLYQIQVKGHDSPGRPSLPPMPGFTVQEAGGQQNNSESVTIVNGRMNRVVTRGYIFNYRLTPQKTGRLSIPSVSLTVEGKEYRSNAIPIQVKAPKSSDDFQLRQQLTPASCYVGEALTLTTTWYLSRDVRNYSFSLPILHDNRFLVEAVEVQQKRNRDYVKLSLGDHEVIAEKSQQKLKNKSYATISFKHILIPRQVGDFELPRSTISCEGKVGNQRPRSALDSFFSANRGTYETFSASAKPLKLTVNAMPKQGRPTHFSGLIGRYSIKSSATPTEVNVGDPITLTVQISGSEHLKHFDLPPLQEQENLAAHFKIPTEIADGSVQGNTKTFTQTIRAQDATVKAIPPIQLSYFDSKAGAYKVAKSKAIPLRVHETKVLTAEDAEGVEPLRVRNRITAWQEGIAYNYEDAGVLQSQDFGPAQWLGSPAWLLLIFLPPISFTLLSFILWRYSNDHANPDHRRARKAASTFAKSMADMDRSADAYPKILEALREYLGAKLQLTAGAITHSDVEKALAQRAVSEAVIRALVDIFQRCEAHQYAAGQSSAEESARAIEESLALIQKLEKELKR